MSSSERGLVLVDIDSSINLRREELKEMKEMKNQDAKRPEASEEVVDVVEPAAEQADNTVRA